jgi:large subunit ribosomal protein L6
MSRIGKAPVLVPSGVTVAIDDHQVTVQGPLGKLVRLFRPEVTITQEGQHLYVSRNGETRLHRSLHGLSRTLLYNMVEGVANGFTVRLELVGVGYKAQVAGDKAILSLGYSHTVDVPIPSDLSLMVEGNTKIAIKGPDKQAATDLAAYIRSRRPPEPYKGKGVRYEGEKVRRKAGKAGKK